MRRLWLLFAIGVLFMSLPWSYSTADNITSGGGIQSLPAGPGIGNSSTVCNPGAGSSQQSFVQGSTVYVGTCGVSKTAAYVVNSDLGGISDTGRLIKANAAASITFTMPNPSGIIPTYQFADQTGHGYLITTVGGTATFSGCITTPAVNISAPAWTTTIIADNGSGYFCTFVPQTQVPQGAGSNLWNGANYQPWCGLAFTNPLASNAATCAANAAASPELNSVTLTGNTTWQLPSGLKSGETVVYRFAQDATGGRTLTLPTSGILAPAASLSGSNIILTGTPNSIDQAVCVGYGGTAPSWTATEMDCPGWTLNLMTPIAAPTHVQGNFGAESSGGTSITVVTAAGIGASHTIVGAVAYSNPTAAVSSCGDGTNTYTLGTDVIGSIGQERLRPFYKTGAAATTGATTITCTFSSSVQFMQMIYDEYSSGVVDGIAAQSQINPGTAVNAVSSGTFTTTQTDLIWGATFSTQSSTTMAVGTGFSALSHSTSGADFSPFTEQQAGVPAGSVAATYTNGTNGANDTNMTAGIALH